MRRGLRWRRTTSRGNVSSGVADMSAHLRAPALTCGTTSETDPEVHIGLENLQHFPAFGSPPHHSRPPAQPDFSVEPPSPLGSSPSSGELLPVPCLSRVALQKSKVDAVPSFREALICIFHSKTDLLQDQG